MRYEFHDTCPYCRQTLIDYKSDARDLCGCMAAKKWRNMQEAIAEIREEGVAMDPLDEDTVDMLCNMAHLIAGGQVDSATLSLEDGSKITLGMKVARTAKIKREKAV